MPLVEHRFDGPYETNVFELAHGLARFQWVVVDTRSRESWQGRSSTQAWANHDARERVRKQQTRERAL